MSLESNIVQGLERISEVFKTLLLEKAKKHGISPIQIQILLFINSHRSDLTNVTHLAKEFNLTKATVSDAIKSLYSKAYVEKDFSNQDSRSYSLFISPSGKTLIQDLENYSLSLEKILIESKLPNPESLYSSLTQVIFQLNQQGIIQVQRTCFACKFYSNENSNHYCKLLKSSLKQTEIRLDCEEFEEKSK